MSGQSPALLLDFELDFASFKKGLTKTSPLPVSPHGSSSDSML